MLYSIDVQSTCIVGQVRYTVQNYERIVFKLRIGITKLGIYLMSQIKKILVLQNSILVNIFLLRVYNFSIPIKQIVFNIATLTTIKKVKRN